MLNITVPVRLRLLVHHQATSLGMAGDASRSLAPDGYLVTNTVGVICAANPQAARLLGRPRRWLVGKSLAGCVARQEARRFHTLLHTLHREPPSGRAWVGDFHPAYGQAFIGELTVAIRQEVSLGSKWLPAKRP